MSLGQRIAQKRKELSLSQEALGEQLGVSRQAIYKWESDATLPEIEKLIALSKLFGVSVGWLLGVEEPVPPEPEISPAGNGELTEAQLKMVEEIVERYLAAQPNSFPQKRRRLFSAAVVICALFLVAILYNLSGKLDRLNSQYNNLQNSVSNVTSTVNSQINGISNRVEEILKSQNSLTAEYGTEVSGTNLEKNQIRFAVYAVPKTYVEGMEVKFSADNHTGGINNAHGEEGFNQKFSATLATGLTDNITLSATFIYPDGAHETQLLDTYEGLFSASLPTVYIDEYHLFAEEVPDGTLTIKDLYITTRKDDAKSFQGSETARIETVQVGFFRNQKLLAWAQPCEKPNSFHGFEGRDFYRLPDMMVENLTEEDQLDVAALVTDSYGRQFMACDAPYVVKSETDFDTPYLTYPSIGRCDPDPANWEFK